MDIYDKRDVLLDLSIDMLNGDKPRNDDFLILIDFENWIVNSGLSGFTQTIHDKKISVIENFALEQKFDLIAKMASVLRRLYDLHGEDFVDKLSDSEYGELGQYDDDFIDFHDIYTDTLYKKYVEI